ncbi:MAG TPA: hypothetical protein VFT91_07995 [Dehalococcoidia bacterium]|nr:hypothetical protein [Dehalococcoidia bacterium]
MALRFLERLLRRELAARGREELMDAAVGRIGLTDDGGTVYVHLFPREGWPHRAQGRAYVLAWQDYAEKRSQRFDCYRWLIREAKLSLVDNVDGIVRWLEGK